MAPVLDEEVKIGPVVRRTPRDVVDEVLVIDDGCTIGRPRWRELGASVLPMGRTVGVGAALRAGYAYAVRRGYDVAVVMAGNNKDSPGDSLLLDPIADERADFVQGSRWLKRDANFGEMPFYRRIATRMHPLLFSLAARRRVHRARTASGRPPRVLIDPRLHLRQPWLDEYELEPYLCLRAISSDTGRSVPVTKVYPPGESGRRR
jgi:dolichol-phosphate mannosyltransferase